MVADMTPITSPTIQPATFWLTSTAPKMVASPTMPTVANSRVEVRSFQPLRIRGWVVEASRGAVPGRSEAETAEADDRSA
jgi:hypothetical protein